MAAVVVLNVAPAIAIPVAVYQSTRGMTIKTLTAAINDNADAIKWAKDHGLLAGSRVCRRCPGNMVMEACLGGDKWRWRCPTAGCRSTLSLRVDSFYTNSKLSLFDSIMVGRSILTIRPFDKH